jgi:hypothetical protein
VGPFYCRTLQESNVLSIWVWKLNGDGTRGLLRSLTNHLSI